MVVAYQTSKGKETIQKVSAYPQGLAILPCEGGLLDQPHRLMMFFEEFLDGERLAFSRNA